MAFSSNDGSMIGARYKSGDSCTYVNNAIIHDDLIIASIHCQGYGILIYDMQASTFIIKDFRYSIINGVLFEKLSQR